MNTDALCWALILTVPALIICLSFEIDEIRRKGKSRDR